MPRVVTRHGAGDLPRNLLHDWYAVMGGKKPDRLLRHALIRAPGVR